MLIRSLHLRNFLSYGDKSQAIALAPLNVIIGPNGAGKSNFMEAIDLLRAAPQDLQALIRSGGGIQDWLWKGSPSSIASIDAVVNYRKGRPPLRYQLAFTETAQRFTIVDERIENETPDADHTSPYLYYAFQNGHPVLNVEGKNRRLQHEDIEPDRSILAQRRDPNLYPELTHLGNTLPKIAIYRNWSFGRHSLFRTPQKADLPNDILEPDARNLGLVLNRFEENLEAKNRLSRALKDIYEGIDDYFLKIEGGTVQLFFREGSHIIPATRLSDGTLHYLCLLAILLNPTMPPLVCIEEPELGLHPDVLITLGELLKEASERCQLIVTTHSDVLVDSLSNWPESVIVAEKAVAPESEPNGDWPGLEETEPWPEADEGEEYEEMDEGIGTQLRRLDAEELKPWLEQYRLGQLWRRGDLGGTRW